MKRELQKRIAAWREETLALERISEEVRRVMHGGRTPRGERAKSESLKKASNDQFKEAKRLLNRGRTAHSVEAYFRDHHGVRITRNWLSRQRGALR